MNQTADRVTRGALWVLATRWTVRLIGLVSVIVLARLLLPEDFGLVAIAMTYVLVIEGLSDFDVSKALIRSPYLDKSLFDTAWTLTLARGVLASAIMMLSASLMASFMEDRRLESIIYVLSLAPFLQGLSNPKFVTFEKNLIFSKHSIVMILQKIASLLVSLTIALIYQSYWALILGTVAASLVNLVLSYLFIPYRPSPSLAKARELFSFSGWMSLATIISTLSMHLDNFIVGYMLGIKDTGNYYMTRQIGALPTQNLIDPINQVLFPSFSEISDNRAQLKRIVIEAIGITASIGLAVSIGFALIINNFVLVVLGEKWIDIIPYLQVLVPVFGLQAIFSTAQPIVMSVGATRALCINALIYSQIRLPLFVAATLTWGLTGAIWSLVISGSCYCLLQYRLMYVALGLRPKDLWLGTSRPIVAMLTMVMAVVTIERFAADVAIWVSNPWLLMLCKVVVGGLVFCISHYCLWVLLHKPTGIEMRAVQLLRKYCGGYSFL